MATLAVYRGEQLLRKVELGEGPMRIGRAPENEIVLEDANKGVSRMHAEIRYEEGRYVILDLNSQNGVWIKERRIKVDPLPVNEPVTVGPYRLVLLPDAGAVVVDQHSRHGDLGAAGRPARSRAHRPSSGGGSDVGHATGSQDAAGRQNADGRRTASGSQSWQQGTDHRRRRSRGRGRHRRIRDDEPPSASSARSACPAPRAGRAGNDNGAAGRTD